MKIAVKVFFLIVILFFTDYACFALDISQQDTVSTRKPNKEFKGKTDETNPKKVTASPAGNTDNKQVQGSIKQIKGARLDMSKARGARPPDIVRPNGSRIPQGIGKPAGAGKPGRS